MPSDPNEISNVKSKSLKKIEYWQKNGAFTFFPKVKINRLIAIFRIVFSIQLFDLKRTLQRAKTQREFIRLPPNFESDFYTNTSHISHTILKTFHNFSLELSMAKRRHVL